MDVKQLGSLPLIHKVSNCVSKLDVILFQETLQLLLWVCLYFSVTNFLAPQILLFNEVSRRCLSLWLKLVNIWNFFFYNVILVLGLDLFTNIRVCNATCGQKGWNQSMPWNWHKSVRKQCYLKIWILVFRYLDYSPADNWFLYIPIHFAFLDARNLWELLISYCQMWVLELSINPTW